MKVNDNKRGLSNYLIIYTHTHTPDFLSTIIIFNVKNLFKKYVFLFFYVHEKV